MCAKGPYSDTGTTCGVRPPSTMGVPCARREREMRC
ncbi:unnamed protein product [Ectocarpus sp. 6 AP-2014]